MGGSAVGVPGTAVDRWFGVDHLDTVFGDAAKVVCPWPRVGRVKGGDAILRAHTDAVLAGPVHLSEVDPRTLHASQPWVLRQHAAYYRTGVWEVTGLTSADRESDANRFPLIVQDRLGRLVIRTGHHRALVALVEGRPLRCRLAPGGEDGAVALLPRVLCGPTSQLEHVVCDDVAVAVALVGAGTTVRCIDPQLAADVRRALVPAGVLVGGVR